ncbi:MAG: hypothetical protein M3Q10_12380 [Chloroflexota bacterium]|nr:hypothetical protein [Chloroflexota bacterium]
MIDHDANHSRPSPLDPFIVPFLRELAVLEDGYAPAAHGPKIAATLDWPPAFCEAVFASARGRGMVEPYRTRGARGRARWRVSSRGSVWLTARDADGGGDFARP